MRVERLGDEQIPADLQAFYVELYDHVGPGQYQPRFFNAPHEVKRFERTLDALRRITERGSCLEVGCAEGVITAELALLFERVVAVDINPSALAHCPAFPNVEYRRVDVERDEITECFDVILLADVLEHLREPVAAIRKCAAQCRWIVAVSPTTERLNLDGAFRPELLFAHRKPGDGGGHIWYVDPEGFGSWFSELPVERVEDGGGYHTIVQARGRL
jgi:SAM-dependent methyltransferase